MKRAWKVGVSNQPGGFLQVQQPREHSGQRHWKWQRPGDCQLSFLYEVENINSEVWLLPDTVIWWELFIRFLLPQRFDVNRGRVGSFDLFFENMFYSSSVITKLHNNMRSFSAYVNRDSFIQHGYLCVHSQNIPLTKCGVKLQTAFSLYLPV